MRFRAGLVLSLFAVLLGAGCRKPLAPNIDRNLAPETWITAAPQDTITTHQSPGGSPTATTIPFRYHLYWAGADADGQVVGYYYAVVETVTAPGLPTAPLPGPKPRDYHFTTKRDSTFIFSVFEGTNSRQHAFYIYSVDNQGKPDPTPARLIFNALDRFPPNPVIDEAVAVGYVFDPNDLGTPKLTSKQIVDTSLPATNPFPRDTVPTGSVITFRWHNEMTTADNPAVGYKYRLQEPEFVSVPVESTMKRYNTGPENAVSVGPKIFTLRAIDRAGGARVSPETIRRFRMNLSPDTWFTGPDSTNSFWTVSQAYLPSTRNGTRYKNLDLAVPRLTWRTLGAVPGTYVRPESLTVMPVNRVPSATFLEIYQNVLFVRTEGDTVDMNSWVIFHSGGFDPDSRYDVRVFGTNPDLPGIGVLPVLTRGPANGSPVGFRFWIPMRLDSLGTLSGLPQSQTYPLSDPALVTEPHIGGFQGMQQSGRAYAIVRAEDGDGGLDIRIPDPVAFVDSCEKGLMPAERLPLRSRIITFYVNRSPYLLSWNTAFEPRAGKTYTIRSIPLRLDMAADDDPYSSDQRTVGGWPLGSQRTPIFRYNVQLRGASVYTGRDTVYTQPSTLPPRSTSIAISTSINVPNWMRGGPTSPVRVQIELCDCATCEAFPGQGRCRNYDIPVFVPAAPPIPFTNASTQTTIDGPGFTDSGRGSTKP
jgi:hypothetical protein